jgi:hypothetical protein
MVYIIDIVLFIYLETAGFEDAPVDGIIGMDRRSTWFNDLVNTGVPDVFSLCFGREGGQLVLGGVDDTLYGSTIDYVPLYSGIAEFYAINLTSITVQDEQGTSLGNLGNAAKYNQYGNIVDTGTTQLIIPTDLFNNFQSIIQDK